MRWWKKRTGRDREGQDREGILSKGSVALPGWRSVKSDEQMVAWQDDEGDAVSLAPFDVAELPALSDVQVVRRYCRTFAEDMRSGLLEADVVTGRQGPAIKFVYKRLEIPEFQFTGILMVPAKPGYMWTVVAREHGMTGQREAVVTAQLMSEGKLTLETYKQSWAQDPYEPTYAGVERRTLRYLSDDSRYDQQFPEHPLSKVRRLLATLLSVNITAS